MIDPATGAIIGTVSGSLTLVNALIKVCQDHEKNPKASPPNIAALVATLPAALLQATNDLIKQVEELRAECRAAGIDLKLNLDHLQRDTGFFQRRRRRVLKTFQAKVESIGSEISVLFDDLVSVCDCADRLNTVSRSFKASAKDKEQLRRDTDEGLPLGTILDNLKKHANVAIATLGDLNRE